MAINTENQYWSESKESDCGMPIPKRNIYTHIPKAQGSVSEEGAERLKKPRSSWWLQGKNVFQRQQDSCTYELKAIVAVHTRPLQPQARRNPDIERGGGHWVPSVAEELLAFDSCWEERLFALKDVTWPVVGPSDFKADPIPKTIWVTQIGFDRF